MVSTRENVPSFVLEADVEAYLQLADPPADVAATLQRADRDDRVRLLARAWFNKFHGSRAEAKHQFAILMDEEGIPFTGDDIRAITEDPPVRTQS